MHRQRDPYHRIAGLYDFCAAVYSAGRVERSKRALLAEIEPGQRLLFAGAGTGAEMIAAVGRGAEVIAVDRSPAMLERLRQRARKAGNEIKILSGEIGELQDSGALPAGGFDLVCAHYFLNVFDPARQRAMLARIGRLARPGGRVVIADFAPPVPGPRGSIQRLYYYTALLAFRILVPNAMHPIYDYAPELPAAGLRLERTLDFPLAFGLIGGFRVWVARKPAD